MSDTHETTTDIIAEISGYRDPVVRERRLDVRLKAAIARERGDCAKLREALIDVVKRLEAYVGCDHHTFHPTTTTCDGITSVGKCGKIRTCAAIFKARAALAAPPRNCDRFDSSTQARAEWYKTEVLPRVEGVVSGVEPPFVDWLFAPATEKKGGAK